MNRCLFRYPCILTVLLFLMVVSSCSHKTLPQKHPSVEAGEYRLPIIETSDVHGNIVNSSTATIHYRLAYIADKVADIRGRGSAYRKDRLLLLDGGDSYQGTTVSNLQKGMPVYLAFDKMDYDAVTVGNHEFDWGLENMFDDDATLHKYVVDGVEYPNEVPVVCANLFQNGKRSERSKDYVIVEKTATNDKGGEIKVKIGVVGFAIDYSSDILAAQFAGKGYKIQEDYNIANSIAKELESSGKCDATILLAHAAADETAERLGKDSPFDLVLGGHTHENLSGETAWGTPYLECQSYALSYACSELLFNVDKNGVVTFSKVSKLETVDVDKERDTHAEDGENADDLDNTVLEFSDRSLAAVRPQLETVIGYIDVDATNNYPDTTLSIPGSEGRTCVMGNWMCDIIRRIGKAEIGFVNAGGIRVSYPLNGADKMDITVANIYEIFPFDNLVYVYEITYDDLLRVFNYAMTADGKTIVSAVTGIDCFFKCQKKEKGKKIYAVKSLVKDGTTIFEDGVWTDGWQNRTVSVAIQVYMATTDRVDNRTQMHNPFVEWNNTSRLKANDQIDNEQAIRVLKEEAAQTGGHLIIDTTSHFIFVNE
jgi:2',3'-cyclic-nucleotide 2'-phosphodiesterase/3'-nucleotidase